MTSESSHLPNLVPLVWTSLFTALISAGALLAVPLGPIPFVLSNFFVMLAGLLLGPLWGSLSVALYLGLGILGLPVFANGTGGLPVLFGPTAGFLLGFLVSVFIIGVLRDPLGKSILHNSMAILSGIAVTYLVGVPVFAVMTKASLGDVVATMIPLVIGDLIKGTLALFLTRTLFHGLPILRSHKN